MNVHGIQTTESTLPYETIACSTLNKSGEFVIDQEKLTAGLVGFSVDELDGSAMNKTPDFIHPFTCKVIGPRGSGKTSFMVSYLKKIARLTFPKIFIVSASNDQPLYDSLRECDQIDFITLEELELVITSARDVLVVFDDVMQETRHNYQLEAIYTRGRHQRISVISLEQDLFYSNHIERRNVDYFVLTKIRDTSCLSEFYRRFCRDLNQWRFIDIFEFAVSPPLGFIIIDFLSRNVKYRINSFNIYFDAQTCRLKYIIPKEKDTLQDLNEQLEAVFMNSILRFKQSK